MNLDRRSVQEILHRFYDFADGTVKSLRIDWNVDETLCSLSVFCQDRDSSSGWSEVLLRVHGVYEFRFERTRVAFEALSSGIQFAWKKEAVFMVLDAYPDEPEDLPNLAVNAAYVVGKSCTYEARFLATTSP